MSEIETFLNNIYYDPSHPASFGGVKNLFQYANDKYPEITLKSVKDWLAGQRAYTLHKPSRNKFPRNRIVVTAVDEQWQADLVDLKHLSRFNSGHKYILTVIDILSKYAWAKPIKLKTPENIIVTFNNIFKNRKPTKLQTDKGKEFKNRKFLEFLRKESVRFFTSNNEDIKCSVVERFNRTLKNKMFRYFTAKNTKKYIDVLQDLIKSYNHSRHRSTKFRPADITLENQDVAFKNIYGVSDVSKLQKKRRPDDEKSHVRLRLQKKVFDKGYKPLWTEEIFQTLVGLPKQDKVLYKVSDSIGTPIEGTFYEHEIQKVKKPDTFTVEKILRRRTKNGKVEYFVKWLGYSDKFNSSVPASDVMAQNKNR